MYSLENVKTALIFFLRKVLKMFCRDRSVFVSVDML